jgi:ribonuclease HII
MRTTSVEIKSKAGLAHEAGLWASGYRRIAGIDEAGRGAWAGPVTAAAVILPPGADVLACLLGRVDDSKRLTPRTRERLLDEIAACAVSVGVGCAGADEIDAQGIVAATRNAMLRAVAALAVAPDFLLLDYLTLPALSEPQRGLPHGDAISLSIAAASIVAKVTRDRWMAAQEALYPGYGLARHKGYGTAEHRAALRRLGPCPIHRGTFRPIAEIGLFPSDGDGGA